MLRAIKLLLLAVFLALPVGVALAARRVGGPAVVGPLIVVVLGATFVVVAGRIVVAPVRRHAATTGIPYYRVLEDRPGDWTDPTIRPVLAWVPFLVTAGWITFLAGFIWLVLTNALVAFGVAILVCAAIATWKLRGDRHRCAAGL